MKRTIFLILNAILVLAACSPIEKREDPGPVLTKDQLDFTVTQDPAGSNTVILENKTKNTLQYWDWGTGFSNKQKDTIYIPFAGTFMVKFTAFYKGGTVTDSVPFTISNNDDAFFDKDPAWKGLTGGGLGKTWVFATDHPSGYVLGNGPNDCIAPQWWQVPAIGSDAWVTNMMNDEVYMDLKGAANFQLTKGSDGSVKKGFFNITAPVTINDKVYSTMEVFGGPTWPWPSDKKYTITNLNENELSIHKFDAADVAVYKQKGFSYK
jgi:hypothetical protein